MSAFFQLRTTWESSSTSRQHRGRMRGPSLGRLQLYKDNDNNLLQKGRKLNMRQRPTLWRYCLLPNAAKLSWTNYNRRQWGDHYQRSARSHKMWQQPGGKCLRASTCDGRRLRHDKWHILPTQTSRDCFCASAQHHRIRYNRELALSSPTKWRKSKIDKQSAGQCPEWLQSHRSAWD